jgi:hypothetical protein
LGYQGVVITDDLYNMKAITDYYGFYEAAELAVNAGVDILLYVNNTYKSASLCRQLVDTLEARVMRGVISEARIDEAFERISRLKSQYNVTGVSGPLASGHLIPADFRLVNYPNPFNPSTTIRFSLPVAGEATVKVYDVLGRELETLIDGRLTAGEHEVRWNAFNRASGVYFCRLQSEGVNETRKLLLRR